MSRRSAKALVIGRMAIATARRYADNYTMVYGVIEFLRGAAEYAEDGMDELYFRRLYTTLERAQEARMQRKVA